MLIVLSEVVPQSDGATKRSKLHDDSGVDLAALTLSLTATVILTHAHTLTLARILTLALALNIDGPLGAD